MRSKGFNRYLIAPVLALVALVATVASSSAQTNLVALNAQATMPDAAVIDMWGFFVDTGQPCATVPVWDVGPTIVATTAEVTQTVNLRNCLNVDVSMFVPGLPKALAPVVTTDSEGRERLVSFDATAPANGGTASYAWPLTPGTHLYHSGTDVRTQLPMGLYGALVVDVGAGEAYPGIGYDQDAVLLFSEIDPSLNTDPANYGGARVTTWTPRYFLINGEAFPGTTDLSVNASEDVLLRFVNASLESHAPTLGGGLYMDVLAEDGHRYPHPLSQYGLELPAAKSIDARVTIGSEGAYALYDRALHLKGGGMLTYLQAGAIAGAPIAVDDAYSVAEDGTLSTLVGDLVFPGVLDNDTAGTGPGPLMALVVSDASAGTLVLAPDGSFTYTPSPNFSGTDLFTYIANDGGPDSNVASVHITVSAEADAPVANPDSVTTPFGTAVILDVLANDSDVDGDLDPTSVAVTMPPLNGTAVSIGDGTITYEPALNYSGPDSFAYQVCDLTAIPLCAGATVDVFVEATPPPNVAPFANDDFAQAPMNSAGVTFSVTANDVDANGVIDVATVVLTTGPVTQRGGTVVANLDGTVTYVPKRGFRGTDTFQYTVNDDVGATSNVATVRINVVR